MTRRERSDRKGREPGCALRHRGARLRRAAARGRVREGGLQGHRLRREPAGGGRAQCRQVAHQGRAATRSSPSWCKRGALRGHDRRRRLGEADAISICVPTPLVQVQGSRHELRRRGHRGGDEARSARGRRSSSRAPPIPARRARSCCRRSRAPGSSVGEDVFLAFSPERVDPGNPKYHTQEHAEGRRRHHARLHRGGRGALRSRHRHDRAGVDHRGGRAGEAAREHVPLA